MVKKRAPPRSKAVKAMDKVSDSLDLVAHATSGYLDRRYKISKKVDEVKEDIVKELYHVKKEFVRTLLESVFLLTGILTLVWGVVLLLSDTFELAYILMAYGVIATIAVLYFMKLKP